MGHYDAVTLFSVPKPDAYLAHVHKGIFVGRGIGNDVTATAQLNCAADGMDFAGYGFTVSPCAVGVKRYSYHVRLNHVVPVTAGNDVRVLVQFFQPDYLILFRQGKPALTGCTASAR